MEKLMKEKERETEEKRNDVVELIAYQNSLLKEIEELRAQKDSMQEGLLKDIRGLEKEVNNRAEEQEKTRNQVDELRGLVELYKEKYKAERLGNRRSDKAAML